jgi:2-hydroxychromene-2-carboxylate isomerase
MPAAIDYYFSPVSPWSYLGHTRFREIAGRAGARINVKPVDYGRIFPASGGLPLKQRPAQRQAYRLMELARWREHLAVPLTIEPKFFPVSPDAAAKLIVAADVACGGEAALDLALALMRACWSEERNLADAATLDAIVVASGLDPAALREVAVAADAQAKYDLYTDEAMARGVFGAPTYAIGEELFWGQDRLDFVARALVPSSIR